MNETENCLFFMTSHETKSGKKVLKFGETFVLPGIIKNALLILHMNAPFSLYSCPTVCSYSTKRFYLYGAIFYEGPLWFSSSIVCLVKSVFTGCWTEIRIPDISCGSIFIERLGVPLYINLLCIIKQTGK
jgi:hypothetical protein